MCTPGGGVAFGGLLAVVGRVGLTKPPAETPRVLAVPPRLSIDAGSVPPRMRTPSSMFRSSAASVRLALVRNATRESATAALACIRPA